MRTSLLLSTIGTALVLLSACGDSSPARSPVTPSPGNDSPAIADAGVKRDDKATEQKEAAPASGKPEVSCKGKIDVGKPAATFSVSAVNGGGKISLEKGKVYVVDFWATWCEPCKKSFPKYQDLYTKYKASGLEIIAVSVDDEKKDIPNFIRSYGAKFPVGWDEGHKIAECYSPSNMPSAYVIDKQGVVRHVHKGFSNDEEKALEKEIKALL